MIDDHYFYMTQSNQALEDTGTLPVVQFTWDTEQSLTQRPLQVTLQCCMFVA